MKENITLKDEIIKSLKEKIAEKDKQIVLFENIIEKFEHRIESIEHLNNMIKDKLEIKEEEK